MPDVPLRSVRCFRNVAVEEHNRSSFVVVVAVGEHEYSRHVGRQDSIVLAFLGKVNQGSRFGEYPQIQTFQESLECLHTHIVSNNQISCDPVTPCVSRVKVNGKGK
jgi:hypothetical protein